MIPRFFDERSCLELAYAELVRAGQRSHRVRMSAFELRRLSLLQREFEQERSRTMRVPAPQTDQMKSA